MHSFFEVVVHFTRKRVSTLSLVHASVLKITFAFFQKLLAIDFFFRLLTDPLVFKQWIFARSSWQQFQLANRQTAKYSFSQSKFGTMAPVLQICPSGAQIYDPPPSSKAWNFWRFETVFLKCAVITAVDVQASNLSDLDYAHPFYDCTSFVESSKNAANFVAAPTSPSSHSRAFLLYWGVGSDIYMRTCTPTRAVVKSLERDSTSVLVVFAKKSTFS